MAVFATVLRESSGSCWKAVSEDSSFLIPNRIFVLQKLKEDMSLDQNDFEHLRELCRCDECSQKALELLGMREHCRFELARKLYMRGFEAEFVKKALDQLEVEGALDEVRFCTEFIRSRLKKKPEGRLLMEQRLHAKGAERAAACKALDQIYCEEYSMELAQKAYKQIVQKTSDELKIRADFAKAGFSSYQFYVVKENR
ncbi:MAG: regulatory protein RecX [Sphaerochaetaceae bacterium]|jgi:SOS response regulatory protein OraA/RecX|nr:regulatory protein RecX [Sphaerochaetaceae bacterium]